MCPLLGEERKRTTLPYRESKVTSILLDSGPLRLWDQTSDLPMMVPLIVAPLFGAMFN